MEGWIGPLARAKVVNTELGLPMEECTLSAQGGTLICIAPVDTLLAVLERTRIRYEN